MGQAAAMTGGYGSSYAQTAGQQAYQGYLQGLNDKVPELYQLALNQYNAEGDAMLNNASLMAQMEDQDYGRHRDQLSDYYTELDRLTSDSRYQAEQDYNKWANDQSFGYQQYRDQMSDKQWQAQFDEAKRQYDEQMALSKSTSSGGNNNGTRDTGTYSSYTAPAGWTKQDIIAYQSKNGLDPDGIWGPKTDAMYQNTGDNRNSSPTPPINPSGFTGSTYSEAAAYLKSKGKSASGLMTQSEWTRHKNKNNSAGGEHEASSYQEYLAAYIYDQLN
jgi:hypothetical protein